MNYFSFDARPVILRSYADLKRLPNAQPCGGSGCSEAKNEYDGRRQNLLFDQSRSEADEKPDTRLHHPVILMHGGLLQHGETDDRNKQQ